MRNLLRHRFSKKNTRIGGDMILTWNVINSEYGPIHGFGCFHCCYDTMVHGNAHWK